MNKIIMSGVKPELCRNLAKFGYEIIYTQNLDIMYEFESTHADMQSLKINDRLFVLKECSDLQKLLDNFGINYVKTNNSIGKKYPESVLLNALFIGNKLYCNVNSLDTAVKDYCKNNGIELVNVNQGYTKCSVAVVDDAFITSDKCIYNTLTENRVEGVFIEPGDIDLVGVDYGFIGGCCFSDEHNVYFTGDVTQHKDYDKINDLCTKKNKNIICLSQNKLYDIGGFVRL